MPFVAISTAKGILDADQKRELLRRVTDLMVEIEGGGREEFRQVVWVKIEEQDAEHWSLGGLVSTSAQIAERFGPLDADGKRAAKAAA